MKKIVSLVLVVITCVGFVSFASAARDIKSFSNVSVPNTNIKKSLGSSTKKYGIQKGVISLSSATDSDFLAWCDILDGLDIPVNVRTGVANRVKYSYEKRPVFSYNTTVSIDTKLYFWLRGDKGNSSSSCSYSGTLSADSSESN